MLYSFLCADCGFTTISAEKLNDCPHCGDKPNIKNSCLEKEIALNNTPNNE